LATTRSRQGCRRHEPDRRRAASSTNAVIGVCRTAGTKDARKQLRLARGGSACCQRRQRARTGAGCPNQRMSSPPFGTNRPHRRRSGMSTLPFLWADCPSGLWISFTRQAPRLRRPRNDRNETVQPGAPHSRCTRTAGSDRRNGPAHAPYFIASSSSFPAPVRLVRARRSSAPGARRRQSIAQDRPWCRIRGAQHCDDLAFSFSRASMAPGSHRAPVSLREFALLPNCSFRFGRLGVWGVSSCSAAQSAPLAPLADPVVVPAPPVFLQ